MLFIFTGIIFLSFVLPPAHADDTNDISIQNIAVQPSMVKVGNTFTVSATLVNNSTVPIVLEGDTCSIKDTQVPFFTVMFDNHAQIMTKNINCAGAGLYKILDPGKKNTSTSPYYTLNYAATESGTANVTVTFQYHVKNQDLTQPNTEQNISKSFQFLIHDVNETYVQKPTNYFSNPDFQIYKIKEKNYEYFLPYHITNSKIQNMTVDCQSLSMMIYLASASANGTLTISLPRSLLDVKTQTGDNDFFILVNRMEVNYLEIEKNQDVRTLSIPFSSGATEIEIIGMAVEQNMPVVPHFCGIGGTNESSYYRLLFPLEQFKLGVEAKDVKCKEGLQFIMKNENGQPACVTPSTIDKLIARGWGIIPLAGLPTSH